MDQNQEQSQDRTRIPDGGSRRKKQAPEADPVIPDKLYFRIGEVARLLAVAPYVLRFWESEFPQLHPGKGGTGQRLFRRRDVEMALRIKRLLYSEGYTIPGARQLLKSEQRAAPDGRSSPVEEPSGTNATPEPAQVRLHRLRAELKEISSMLAGPAPPRTASAGAGFRTAPPARRGLHLAARRDADKSRSPLLFPADEGQESE